MATFVAALTLSAAASRAGATPGQVSTLGRAEVDRIELGYRPADDGLRVRVHLVSGLAVEHETVDPDDVERILAMAQIFASGRAKMFVEVREGAIEAFQLSVP